MPSLDDIRTMLLTERARLIAQIDEALRAITSAADMTDIPPVPGAAPTPAVTITRRRAMTPAARRAISDRMKKYWAERRKGKRR
jgi:hypothetical protein